MPIWFSWKFCNEDIILRSICGVQFCQVHTIRSNTRAVPHEVHCECYVLCWKWNAIRPGCIFHNIESDSRMVCRDSWIVCIRFYYVWLSQPVHPISLRTTPYQRFVEFLKHIHRICARSYKNIECINIKRIAPSKCTTKRTTLCIK